MRIAENLERPFSVRRPSLLRAGTHPRLQLAEARARSSRHSRSRARGPAFAEAEPLALAWLARVRIRAGDKDPRFVPPTSPRRRQRRRTRLAECIAHIGRARVLLRTTGARAGEEVQAALGRALELVEETGARSNEPFVRVQRARLAGLRGDEDTWRRELGAAHQLFVAMGATPRAERLARELG